MKDLKKNIHTRLVFLKLNKLNISLNNVVYTVQHLHSKNKNIKLYSSANKT